MVAEPENSVDPNELLEGLDRPRETVELGELEIEVQYGVPGAVSEEAKAVAAKLKTESPEIAGVVDETVTVLAHITDDRFTREFWNMYLDVHGKAKLQTAAMKVLSVPYSRGWL
ncbi:hypothetical protein SAMN05421809_3040 [Natronorubrum daqingense]|uniref:Uncharacterized protein n=1 Tax=Natronorubrum daqingense TaxID=588898 RepID=A0A1N7F636_9EURY|nr:hypothetical protein BB347_13615 [Natronorubrum daqingense]SIR95801.1 hypothetical protein SAMN05421809_3040 [Natronorubrum daqingense]